MKMEGRTFALTGAQMLELADLLEEAAAIPATWPDGQMSALAWAGYLRREHAAHFGEDGDGE